MKKSFTLIELLVVLAIIGILAAMIIASLSGARSRARDATRKSDLRQVKTALEQYYSDKEKYPVQTTSVNLSTLSSDISTYISKIPEDPQGTYKYQYISDAEGTKYALSSTLENTKDPSYNVTCQGFTFATDYHYMTCND